MANLPVEVITEILSRLPVKVVIQQRLTCKLWRSIIDTSHFILFHLRKSHSTLILRHRTHLYSMDLDQNNPLELSHPLMCYSNSIKVLGSSNGLLCISNVADDIALWNPFLRKHRILPSDRFHRPESSLFAARVHGFGHDAASNDYKLVSITYFVDLHKRSFDSQVQLYTLKSDAWKRLPSMPYALCCARTMGVFVGAALHWTVTRNLEPDEPDLIVAFDLTLETFREVPLPVTVLGNFDMQLALLGGFLCLVENRGSTQFDVWVMKVYGSRDSWDKLFTLTQNHHCADIGSAKLKSVRPLALDGDRVLFEHNRSKLCWYNLKTGDVTCVKIPGIGNSIEATICVQSLIPPTLLSRLCDESERQRLSQHKCRKKRDDFLSQGFKLTL